MRCDIHENETHENKTFGSFIHNALEDTTPLCVGILEIFMPVCVVMLVPCLIQAVIR